MTEPPRPPAADAAAGLQVYLVGGAVRDRLLGRTPGDGDYVVVGATADDLLRRYVRFKPGEVYNPDRLVSLQSRLLGTEYYGKVEIVPHKDPTGESLVVPIEVIAERNQANKFRVGAGFATDIGPRISMDWRRRYLNQWGHNFRTLLSLSPALSQFNFDYRIPIANAILTTENLVQAQARQEDKGRDAARVAIEMANLLDDLS
jgi:outer membrane translocation and assembly module TamA